MDESQVVGVYEISEVRIEQWVLAALTMQRGMSLTTGRRRPVRGPVRSYPPTRSRRSLWLMLGISCLGLCLL
jgi:hypothetical protein